MLSETQIIKLKNKYKNPVNMEKAVENVANMLADEYVKNNYKEIEVNQVKKLKLQENNYISQLENVLLDQIQKLNDDSLFDNTEEAKIVFEKSNAISNLAKNFADLQKTKLDIVRLAIQGEGLYDNVLGIE